MEYFRSLFDSDYFTPTLNFTSLTKQNVTNEFHSVAHIGIIFNFIGDFD